MKLKRKPDIAIGGRENPYLLRWYLIPRNNWFNIYLHKFIRDDDDRAYHDHPWLSLSIVLKGGYYEHRPCRKPGHFHDVVEYFTPLSIVFRNATYRHRIALDIDKCRQKIPAWSIFITGPKLREWGFWCQNGEKERFVHWKEFTEGKDGEYVGRGCSE